eukprot:scaffold16723_cov143-Isochrysis_galbana.AAC.9
MGAPHPFEADLQRAGICCPKESRHVRERAASECERDGRWVSDKRRPVSAFVCRRRARAPAA